MTKEEVVNILDSQLFGWEYGDIIRASIQGKAKLAGFILGSCFIDAMAGYYAGIDKKTAKIHSGKRFKDFVQRYLNKYNNLKLWEDLRCGLVHSYAEGGTYVFTDNEKAGKHFENVMGGKVLLNLEDFIYDLKHAYENLRTDILSDTEVYKRAKYTLENIGIMAFKIIK